MDEVRCVRGQTVDKISRLVLESIDVVVAQSWQKSVPDLVVQERSTPGFSELGIKLEETRQDADRDLQHQSVDGFLLTQVVS